MVAAAVVVELVASRREVKLTQRENIMVRTSGTKILNSPGFLLFFFSPKIAASATIKTSKAVATECTFIKIPHGPSQEDEEEKSSSTHILVVIDR